MNIYTSGNNGSIILSTSPTHLNYFLSILNALKSVWPKAIMRPKKWACFSQASMDGSVLPSNSLKSHCSSLAFMLPKCEFQCRHEQCSKTATLQHGDFSWGEITLLFTHWCTIAPAESMQTNGKIQSIAFRKVEFSLPLPPPPPCSLSLYDESSPCV